MFVKSSINSGKPVQEQDAFRSEEEKANLRKADFDNEGESEIYWISSHWSTSGYRFGSFVRFAIGYNQLESQGEVQSWNNKKPRRSRQ